MVIDDHVLASLIFVKRDILGNTATVKHRLSIHLYCLNTGTLWVFFYILVPRMKIQLSHGEPHTETAIEIQLLLLCGSPQCHKQQRSNLSSVPIHYRKKEDQSK